MEKKQKILFALASLIIVGVVLMTITINLMSQPPSYSKNYTYFQQYPVDVHLEVEDTLSVNGAHFALKTALWSLNDTFNYNLSIVSINTFQDDIATYSDEDLNSSLWSGGTSIEKSIENGRISFKVKFFHGIGPERTYYGNTIRAAGISNYGNRIGIFIGSPSTDFNYNLFKTCKTILHEFGHAFGLEHNLYSAMMYSPEVDPNDEGPPEHPTYAHLYSVVEEKNMYHIVNSTDYQELETIFLDSNDQLLVSFEIMNIDTYTIEEPLNVSDLIPLVNSRTFIEYHSGYENNDLSNVSGIFIEATFYFDNTHTYVTANFFCCSFDVASFSNYWSVKEIQLCYNPTNP